jgi:hypothetical protein
LTATHVRKAVETSAELKRNLPNRTGSPYKELNSTVIYGLLNHSHTWKGGKSNPLNNVERALVHADKTFVQHPVECIDFITTSDLATWHSVKMTYLSPRLPDYDKKLADIYGPNGSASTSYVCHSIADKNQIDYFRPLGVLLSGLFGKLAWIFPDMRQLDYYFRKVNIAGSGSGSMRLWDINIYSEKIRDRVYNGHLSNGIFFDEWSLGFD